MEHLRRVGEKIDWGIAIIEELGEARRKGRL
jgi:hypothetical protein